MTDLSRPWPLGLDENRWWATAGGALALLAVALAFDRPLSLWAQSWPEAVRVALAEITPYGESGWILYPSGVLFAATAILALVVRRKLIRLLLWQFAELFGFFFAGVGLPSLIATLSKRLIGRGRPSHYDDTGLFGVHWNWLDWTYQSFPSGHATTAFALAAVIGFVSERWFYPVLAFASVMAVSRVALGVHYPSDVVGGALLGLIGAYFVRWVFARRGWMFRFDAAGRIAMRPTSSLKRVLALRRRSSAGAPRPGRP
ncbi:MAG: phosphatase PAP2 family protein [Devosia nanyangense]|uniref:Phosphatase PAP2 family protein n=1 Tax=Devosia nanyangense TaxID=1228055 RepID=A0A933L4Y9_9HYPH|nr:phosphatase PAP2 family protein [Devosia nanyangense]